MPYVVIVVGLIAAWVLWRYTSVARGARWRDRQIVPLLDPLAAKLERGEAVSPQDVAQVAALPQTRLMLWYLLEQFDAGNLFPADLRSRPSQAIAQLAYWMLHPNEFGAVAEQWEVVEVVPMSIGGSDTEFLVIKFRMPEGHWAEQEWLLGVAGPYFPDDPPYAGAGAFSRAGDKAETTSPRELVDWFARLTVGKGALPSAAAGDRSREGHRG
jgi:hypothetical protein